jgi:hypothetical protein
MTSSYILVDKALHFSSCSTNMAVHSSDLSLGWCPPTPLDLLAAADATGNCVGILLRENSWTSAGIRGDDYCSTADTQAAGTERRVLMTASQLYPGACTLKTDKKPMVFIIPMLIICTNSAGLNSARNATAKSDRIFVDKYKPSKHICVYSRGGRLCPWSN